MPQPAKFLRPAIGREENGQGIQRLEVFEYKIYWAGLTAQFLGDHDPF
jgi:hypothetical protein